MEANLSAAKDEPIGRADVPKAGRYRWSIVALLFIATTVNYIDRTMLGLLAPDLGKELTGTRMTMATSSPRFRPPMPSASSSWAG